MKELKSLLKTTSKYLSVLEKSGINTPKDFLEYFPRTYEDRSNIKTLGDISSDTFFKDNNKIMTKGKILSKKVFMRGRKKIYDISFEDINGKKGYISIFNSGFLAQKIQEDKRYLILGKPGFKYGKIVFSHPEVIETQSQEDEDIDGESGYASGRLFPVYSELLGIKSGRFARKMRSLMDKVDIFFDEYLPSEFIKKFELMNVVNTIKEIHFPNDMELNKRAFHRVFFDRLLRIQLYSLLNKNDYILGSNFKDVGKPNWEEIKLIIKKLPFKLTMAQKKVIKHLIEDIHSSKPMMRLLQGDVGSGKTVVAAIAAYYTHKILGGQSVFLAPLEVLANQHYRTLAKLFLPLGLNVALLTGSMTKGEKNKIKSDLKSGRIDVIIGTHAILQEDVEFKNLKYAVVDEQHKFGVKQRAVLKRFGSPHILQMSATPIPRSMALAFFGEFDVSIIDEMPVGRKPIFTKIISEKEYIKLKLRILSKINEGQKVFVVTPLIEESEKMEELKAAMTQFEEIKELFPELKGKIGLLHGKMKSKDKDEMMNKFKSGKISLLVSTTVIEVGVDVPEATIMIIKNSERFGLSQLHQLRGRIGRSDLQSYCFLETKNKSGDTYKRLKSMEETSDGFKLAEMDLQNRGAGEILGTMQSGESDIPLNFLSDLKFIEKVQEGAKWLLEKYPNLEGLDLLKKYLNEKMGDVLV
ncbi:ATP-dependent DNA helicase RecG [Candidatus Gracilibacteria bacterium]|nr:ATP-dependent DNA helicase RecG [Candidatus Gracilibacteria bacterium]